jgi:hypothetical protein
MRFRPIHDLPMCKLCGEILDEDTGLCPDPQCSALCDSCDAPRDREGWPIDAGKCSSPICGEVNILSNGRWYPIWYMVSDEVWDKISEVMGEITLPQSTKGIHIHRGNI